MKILDAKVDWRKRWANRPDLHVLVDEIPTDLKFERRQNLYCARKDGFVQFYSWTAPSNNGGFCGREFPIKMKDGSDVLLLGPWSSGSYAVNELFDFKCLDVIYSVGDWGSSFTGAMELDFVKRSVLDFGIGIVRDDIGEHEFYCPGVFAFHEFITKDDCQKNHPDIWSSLS